MKALVYSKPWQINLEEREEPRILSSKDVIVKIYASGICGTDLGIISGSYNAYPSVILGHESAGEVIEVGRDVNSLKIGDRVVIDPTYYCGLCYRCRSGRENHCINKNGTETGVSKDGTFTKLFKTEEKFLYKLADNVTYEEATMTEPLSCILTGISQIELKPYHKAIIMGAGPIGMLYSYVLRSNGIEGGIIEISQERKLIVQDKLPNNWAVYGSLEEAAKNITPIYGKVDIIVDTTGRMAQQSIPYLDNGGYLMLVGLRNSNVIINPMEIVDRSIRIIGSIDSVGTFPSAKHMIESNMIPVKKLISHIYSISEYKEALYRLGCDLENQQLLPRATGLKIILRS